MLLSNGYMNISSAGNSLIAFPHSIVLNEGDNETGLYAGELRITNTTDDVTRMNLLPDQLRFDYPSGSTIYSSDAISGNLDVSGNINFQLTPTVETPVYTDRSNKIASTYFVQNALNSFVQAGTTGTIGPTGTYRVSLAVEYPFPTPPHVLVTPLNTGIASVSSSPAPTTTEFTVVLGGGCTFFNWVAMGI